jgi:hypothetical protein
VGNDDPVVSHKLCGFQGHVGRHVVVMKEPVVVAPKFQSFSSHIFSQVSQNIMARVQVRVDRSVRRNKFMVNNPLNIKKKQWACALLNTVSAMPFLLLVIVDSSTAMIVALLLDHNRKSNFHHPL